jgi:hypothetical protein
MNDPDVLIVGSPDVACLVNPFSTPPAEATKSVQLTGRRNESPGQDNDPVRPQITSLADVRLPWSS